MMHIENDVSSCIRRCEGLFIAGWSRQALFDAGRQYFVMGRTPVPPDFKTGQTPVPPFYRFEAMAPHTHDTSGGSSGDSSFVVDLVRDPMVIDPGLAHESSAGPPPGFWRTAIRRDVVIRACRYAVIVGTVLVVINHSAALMAGDLSLNRLVQIGLTYCVPYAVTTLASVQAIRGEV